MKKHVVISLTAAMSISAVVACASPMDSYEQGKIAIDLGMSISPTVESGVNDDFDGKSRFYGGITVGLGENWGVQYKYADNKGELFESDAGLELDSDLKIKAQEFNVLYQVDKNLTAFLGYTHDKYKNASVISYAGSPLLELSHNTSNSGYQVGVIGRYDLGNRMTGWAGVGFGNKRTTWELGLGYDITDNVEWNISYNDTRFKDLDSPFGGTFTAKSRGVRTGVTVKF